MRHFQNQSILQGWVKYPKSTHLSSMYRYKNIGRTIQNTASYKSTCNDRLTSQYRSIIRLDISIFLIQQDTPLTAVLNLLFNCPIRANYMK